MKKNIHKGLAVVLIAVFVLCGLSAASKKTSRGIPLQGYVDELLELNLNSIVAGDMDVPVGMPFDITDDSVMPSISDINEITEYDPSLYGRPIATWGVSANCGFTISVIAEPLKNIAYPTAVSLDYYLMLDADLSHTDADGVTRTVDGMIFAGSNTATRITWQGRSGASTNNIGEMADVLGDERIININDGLVSFCFTEDSWTIANSFKAPAGTYRGAVTIVVESTL